MLLGLWLHMDAPSHHYLFLSPASFFLLNVPEGHCTVQGHSWLCLPLKVLMDIC